MQKTIFHFFTRLACAALSLVAAQTACAGSLTHQPFGNYKDGTPVELYTLRNANGCEVKITNYGGIVTSLVVPDRDGKMGDVVLGYDSVERYVARTPYFGALIGRYGNRIAKGKFTLDGKEYQLATNNAPNALHGGVQGFDKRVWQAKEVSAEDGPALELTYVSKDGEEGYPGTLTVRAIYTWTNDNALRVAFEATTDAPTVVNLTNHSYFNLLGAGEGDVLHHTAMLNATRYIPVDETSIPLGEPRPVAGTAFDFTKPTEIGARLNDPDAQLHIGAGGYDHTFVLAGYDRKPGEQSPEPTLAARISEPTTGRVLELWTSEPGVQFYTGNNLNGSIKGKEGKAYNKQAAFCLEPQHFPDSPNRPEYPSVVLRPGETYRNTFFYRFSVQP